MQPLQVILSLGTIVVILIACYYTTYYISVKASGQSRGRFKTRNINLLDRYSVSRDKSFCIVEIAGKVYILGVTNQTMTLIDTLDAAAFKEAAADPHERGSMRASPVGMKSSKFVNRLAAFIASRTGRPPPSGASTGNGSSFADSMDAAREKRDDEEN